MSPIDVFPEALLQQAQFNIAKKDERMAQLMATVGAIHFSAREDCFCALARSIVGQQLSVKAAGTIWGRAVQCLGEMQPDSVLSSDDQLLRAAGLSTNKVAALKALSQSVVSGQLDFQGIAKLTDEEAIAVLTQVKGIGRWTAEMFLIFSLGRQDVLAYDDVGLQRSMKWLYGLKTAPTKKAMIRYGNKWKPFRSVASLFLWEAINRDLIGREVESIV